MGLQNNQSEVDGRVTVYPTFGMEAIIPTEIGMPTIRTNTYEEANAKAITKDLDTTDELREATAVRIASYIPAEASKLAQLVCEAACIQSR